MIFFRMVGHNPRPID